jgi:predicted transcriptional regulator
MKIVSRRRAAGITQAELAERCETTQQQIAKIETGVVDPRLSTLRKIASALECELSDLFYTSEEFINAINEVVSVHNLDLKKLNVIDLNIICSKEKGLPSFHPYWEIVRIEKSKNFVFFKEEK